MGSKFIIECGGYFLQGDNAWGQRTVARTFDTRKEADAFVKKQCQNFDAVGKPVWHVEEE